MTSSLSIAFFEREVATVARALIGLTLEVDGVGGRVVEAEAYDVDDPASHSFRGQTMRNTAMFGPVGHVYIYRSYGLHWCLNVVCGSRPGGAVLIRALEPLMGLETMAERRGMGNRKRLCSGPGRLCQALGVDGSLNGVSLSRPPFRLFGTSYDSVEAGPRVGISRAADKPWRFWLTRSSFVSGQKRISQKKL